MKNPKNLMKYKQYFNYAFYSDTPRPLIISVYKDTYCPNLKLGLNKYYFVTISPSTFIFIRKRTPS